MLSSRMKGVRGCEGRQRCEVWGDDGGERERVLWAQTQEDDALASQESSRTLISAASFTSDLTHLTAERKEA